MAWRNMFSTEKVKQKGAKTIHYTFRCYPSCRKAENADYFGTQSNQQKKIITSQNTRLHCMHCIPTKSYWQIKLGHMK